jgi:hypothetical protein
MFFLAGRRACFETIYAVSRMELGVQDGRGEPVSMTLLKQAYNRTLHRLQPDVPIAIDALSTRLVTDRETESRLLQFFPGIGPNPVDLPEHPDRLQMELVGSLLRKSDGIESGLWESFRFVVNSLICRPAVVSAGGTSAAAVGAVWVKNTSPLQVRDLKEQLLREHTHTQMFLDEWRYGHYQDPAAIVRAENHVVPPFADVPWSISAILHEVVARTEILLFRERHLGHADAALCEPPSEELARSVDDAIDAMYSLPKLHHLLTHRSFCLIQECRRLVRNITDCARRVTH